MRLNYLYSLLFSKTCIAVLRGGLDTTAGYFHTDSNYRVSINYDVMVAVRSDMDDWETQILPRLKEIPIYELSRVTGIDQGNLTLYLSGTHRPNEENIKKIKEGLLRLNGYDEWVGKILPRLKKMPTREAARITGLSYREIQLLKSGTHYPLKDVLEKLEREGE